MENKELKDKMANLYLDGYGADIVPGVDVDPQPGDGADCAGGEPGGGPAGAGRGSGTSSGADS
jgi:hypothetical protein